MLVTFGVPFAKLRQSLATGDDPAPPPSPLPSASGQNDPTTTTELPAEVWQQVASHLPLADALLLRATNAWGFDVVGQSHGPALGARLADLSVSPRRKHRRTELAPGVLPALLASERSLEPSLDTVELDYARAHQQNKHVPRPRATDALLPIDSHLFARLQSVLTAAPRAERIRVPVGLFFSSSFAERPLRLPPNTRTLHLNNLFAPGFADAARDLPSFFAANADRPVEHLMLSITEGGPLGPSLPQTPLFAWRLTSLALFNVALCEVDFARLLHSDFSVLRSLSLLEAPQTSHAFDVVDEVLDGPQFRALCSLPWAKLEHLALAGTFDDTDVYALTQRSWPALAALQLGGPNVGNASSPALATLRAPKLASLTLRGSFDAGALATLLQPRNAHYTSLSVLGQQQDSPRNVPYALYAGLQPQRPTSVRTLWLGQATPLLLPHAVRLLGALQPFVHALQELELHTCTMTHEISPWTQLAAALNPASTQTTLRRSHCG